MSASIELERAIAEAVDGIKKQAIQCVYGAARDLKNAELDVLSGPRSGRVYFKSNTRAKYTASAPGEAPAARTGLFRQSWRPVAEIVDEGNILRATGRIESDMQASGCLLGEMLEEGTSHMAPRPYRQAIIEQAEETIHRRFERIKP